MLVPHLHNKGHMEARNKLKGTETRFTALSHPTIMHDGQVLGLCCTILISGTQQVCSCDL